MIREPGAEHEQPDDDDEHRGRDSPHPVRHGDATGVHDPSTLPPTLRLAAPMTPTAPDTRVTSTGTARYSELDGLRAVSVIAVFLFHIVPAAPALFGQGWDPSVQAFGFTIRPPLLVIEYVVHLNLGVQVFFVLSGFLITSMFVRPYLDGRSAPALSSYSLRRSARIFPAYWLVLLVAGVTWFGLDELDFPLPFGIWKHASLTYLYFREGSPPGYPVGYGGLSVSWSLVAEITFYAFVPLWLLGVRAAGARSRVRAAVLGAAACIPLGVVSVFVFAFANSWSEHTVFGGVITVFGAGLVSLGIGMVLAAIVAGARNDDRLASRLRRIGARSASWWVVAALLYLVLVWPPFPYIAASSGQQVWQRLMQPLIAGVLVAPMVFAPGAGSRLHRLLRYRPMMWVGTVSYGIYLWHTIVINRVLQEYDIFHRTFLGAASIAFVAWVITLGVAAMSWYLLERPVLNVTGRIHR
jgi:peptidoglycan/LPS O-acetylase OafA/YrhL